MTPVMKSSQRDREGEREEGEEGHPMYQTHLYREISQIKLDKKF